ncbi:MAG TPA: indolepyruvate oxidoreductase subunit beta [Clostridia bacterium]|nr:indolepyruvate oxidoreductase subunit beta [Clostridia bacterium]
MVKSIVIAGVGGQGTLLASRLIGEAATSKGYDVKVSEVHGMAQRGGSVITYVRYGDEVISPIIPLGEADVLIAFEQLEALRWLKYLKKGGLLISSTQKIDPMPVITSKMEYPDDIVEVLSEKVENCIFIDALSLAVKAGSTKAVNSILIGRMAKDSDIDKDTWIKALKKIAPLKFIDLNIIAFELGYNFS